MQGPINIKLKVLSINNKEKEQLIPPKAENSSHKNYVKENEFQKDIDIQESFSGYQGNFDLDSERENMFYLEQDLESKANKFSPRKQNLTPSGSLPIQIGMISPYDQESVELNKGRLSQVER